MNVVDKKPKKGASHVLGQERERTLATAVKRRASSIYFLERAFEETGCSCSPHRRRLREVEAQFDAERDQLMRATAASRLPKVHRHGWSTSGTANFGPTPSIRRWMAIGGVAAPFFISTHLDNSLNLINDPDPF